MMIRQEVQDQIDYREDVVVIYLCDICESLRAEDCAWSAIFPKGDFDAIAAPVQFLFGAGYSLWIAIFVYSRAGF